MIENDYSRLISECEKQISIIFNGLEWKNDEKVTRLLDIYYTAIWQQIHNVLVNQKTNSAEKQIRDILARNVIGFVDKKKKALGFYFNGAIQFLCPLENIFDISVKPLMAEPVYEKQSKVGAILGGLVGVSVGSDNECVGNRATSYEIAVSYFDENEESNQYKIKLDDIRYYSIYARDKEYGRTFAQYRDTLLFNMNNFIKRFAGAIDSIKAEADVLRQKPGKAEEFDFEKLNADYEAAKKVVDEKRTRLQAEWDKTVEKKKKANKIKTIVGLSLGGAVVLFIIICGLIGA